MNEDFVVKVLREDAVSSFANVKEWAIWEEIEYRKDIKKWFAPCERITDDGKILIQKKVRIRDIENYPEKIPSFFVDVKQENFGFIGKQLVCFDYNTMPLVNNLTNKFKKANWDK